MSKLKTKGKCLLCLLLVLIMLAPMMLAGCKSTDPKEMAQGAYAMSFLSSMLNDSTLNGDIRSKFPDIPEGMTYPSGYAIRKYGQTLDCSGQSMQAISITGNYATITLRDSMCGAFTAYAGYAGTKLTLEGQSAIGLFQTKTPVAVDNPPGSIYNADIWPGGEGTTFTNMPDMLILRPGTWAIVNGEKYDNTNGTEDMVLFADDMAKEMWGTLRISMSDITLKVGETVFVEPVITPLTAGRLGTFEIENTAIADPSTGSAVLSVSVTGKQTGTTTLTYTHKATGKTATCTVTVFPAENTAPAPTPEPTPAPTPEPTVTLGGELGKGTLGQNYYAVLLVSGNDGSYMYDVYGLPDGITVNAARTNAQYIYFEGIPTQAGSFDVTALVLRKSDKTEVLSKSYTLQIHIPPTIDIDSLANGTVGQAYAATLKAKHSEYNSDFKWDIWSGSLPDGLTLSADGKITGTPTASGDYTFAVRATDCYQIFGFKELTLHIASGIVFTTETLPQATQGEAYSATLSAANGEGALSYSITQGSLPVGLTLSEAGAISGTPTTPGTYPFTASVTDGKGNTATKQLSIFVTDLRITTDLPASVTKNESLSDSLIAAGGSGTYKKYQLISGALPTGLTLDEATGDIWGTYSKTGTYTFTIKVTDSAGTSATRQYTIGVKTDLSLGEGVVIPLTEGTTGTPYSDAVYAIGGVSPYSYTVTEGSLPDGLSMDAGGNITGTPTTTTVQTQTFTVTVTDGEDYTASHPFSITIYLAPPP